MIRSMGFDGDYVLVGEDDQPLRTGQRVQSTGNETVVLTGGRAPHKPGSTGKVWIREGAESREYFPGVIRARWRRAPIGSGP